MISKNQIKKIASLGQKKQRDLHQLFVVEGRKSVMDVAVHLKPLLVFATAEWIHDTRDVAFEVHEVSDIELKKISQLKNPQGVVAVFPIQKHDDSQTSSASGLILALDDVRDPGNLGTIIRLADWFGVNAIICSRECADMYNPKVVQASMGSIARVRAIYTDLEGFLKKTRLPVFGTFMEGDDIYKQELPSDAIVVMGNEGKGISPEIEQTINNKICIPSFSKAGTGAESLNVSTATAIVCSEFKRR